MGSVRSLDSSLIREKLEEERKKILDIKSGGEAGLPMRIKLSPLRGGVSHKGQDYIQFLL